MKWLFQELYLSEISCQFHFAAFAQWTEQAGMTDEQIQTSNRYQAQPRKKKKKYKIVIKYNQLLIKINFYSSRSSSVEW
jgi:hypothetical protein